MLKIIVSILYQIIFENVRKIIEIFCSIQVLQEMWHFAFYRLKQV